MADNPVQGLDDLQRALAALQAGLAPQALVPVVLASVQPMAEDAREHIAVASGKAQHAITTTAKATRHSARASVTVVGSGPGGASHEAVFLEYGTEHMAARPFMRPAFVRNRGEAARIVEEHLAQLVANAKR